MRVSVDACGRLRIAVAGDIDSVIEGLRERFRIAKVVRAWMRAGALDRVVEAVGDAIVDTLKSSWQICVEDIAAILASKTGLVPSREEAARLLEEARRFLDRRGIDTEHSGECLLFLGAKPRRPPVSPEALRGDLETLFTALRRRKRLSNKGF